LIGGGKRISNRQPPSCDNKTGSQITLRSSPVDQILEATIDAENEEDIAVFSSRLRKSFDLEDNGGA